MKKLEGYICETCGELWKDEKRALECESQHIDYKKLKIGWAKYNDYETIHDIDNREKKLQKFIPQTIKVEYRDKQNSNQFAFNSIRTFIFIDGVKF